MQHYNAILLEDINSKMELVIEGMEATRTGIQSDMQQMESRLMGEMDLLKAAVTAHSGEINGLKTGVQRLDAKIDQVDASLSAKIDHVDASLSAKIDQVDARLSAKIDQVDAKIDQVDARLSAKIDQVDARLSAKIDRVERNLSEKIDQQNTRWNGHENRIASLEKVVNA